MARRLSAAVTTANVQTVPDVTRKGTDAVRPGSEAGVVRLVTLTVEGMGIVTAGNKAG
jgi:hypothetical protein